MGCQTAPPGGQKGNDTTAPPGGRYSNTSTAPLLSILGYFGSFRSVFGSLWGHLGRFGVVGGLTQLMQGAERQLHLMGTPPFQDPQQRPQNRPELWGHRRSCNTTGPHWGPPPFRDHHPNYRDPPPLPFRNPRLPHFGYPPTPYWAPPPFYGPPTPIIKTPPQPHIGDPPPIETPSAHIGIAPPF